MPPRRVSSWLLKLLGLPSLTVALINAVARFYRLHCCRSNPQLEQTKKKDDLQPPIFKRTMTSLGDLRLLQTYDRPEPKHFSSHPLSHISQNHSLLATGWGTLTFASDFLRLKKKVTISLKNTILWNPSRDIRTPNHAFIENATVLLRQLCQTYNVYIIVKLNSDNERKQIKKLLKNADLPEQLDTNHIVYCSTNEEKIQAVRRLSPSVHVEGGCELDDGAEAVHRLQAYARKLIWVNARRRRSSMDRDDAYRNIQYRNVELAHSLCETSVAHHSRKMTAHINLQNTANKSSFY